MKVNQLKYSEEQIKEFGEYYKAGYSLKETAEHFNVNYHTLKQNLIRFGYRTPKKSEQIKFMDFIYKDSSIYLKRKHDKFLQIPR